MMEMELLLSHHQIVYDLENVSWSSGGSIPLTGVYYVCFAPNITSKNSISVILNIKRSANTTSS
jgi:hypothetical protein